MMTMKSAMDHMEVADGDGCGGLDSKLPQRYVETVSKVRRIETIRAVL